MLRHYLTLYRVQVRDEGTSTGYHPCGNFDDNGARLGEKTHELLNLVEKVQWSDGDKSAGIDSSIGTFAAPPWAMSWRFRIGESGEEYPIFDGATKVFDKAAEHEAVFYSTMTFVAPPNSQHGVLLVHRCGAHSPFTAVREALLAKFRTTYPQLVMEIEALVPAEALKAVLEQEAWRLQRVNLKHYRKDDDVASQQFGELLQQTELGEIELSFIAKRRKGLAKNTLDKILEELGPGGFVTFNGLEFGSPEAHFARRNQRRKVSVEGGGMPRFSEEVTDRLSDKTGLTWTLQEIHDVALALSTDYGQLPPDGAPPPAAGATPQP
jgi:hypothetical protein